MSQKQKGLFLMLLMMSAMTLVACRVRNDQAILRRTVTSNFKDIRYGISSGIFTRIFAKNVCSCLFVSGLKNSGFDLPYCMEQSNLYFALNIKGNLEPVYLDWIMKVQASVSPHDPQKNPEKPIYVTASGSKAKVGFTDSPEGLAVFDPGHPEFGCRLVATKE